MKKTINYFILLQIFGLFLLSSCSPKVLQDNSHEVKQEKVKTIDLTSKLDSLNQAVPSFFYGKVSTSYTDNKKDLSFKTSLKIKPDSAVSALITYAGIPILNSIVTKDSVKYQNKRDKCYVEKSLDFLKTTFNIPFEFDNVVQLLLGLPVGFEKGNKYFQLQDSTYHVISTHKVRHKKDSLQYISDSQNDIVIKYFLAVNGDYLDKIEIESPADNVKMTIQYFDRREEGTTSKYNLPHAIRAQIVTPDNKIKLSLDFERIEVNNPQQIIYNVPTSYVVCE